MSKIENLKKICHLVKIEDDENLIKKYSLDWRKRIYNKALCVVFPKNEEEVSRILKFCNKNNLKVVPQGGNTNLVASASPSLDKKEIIINFEKMNNINEIDIINKCVDVDSGVIVDNLNQELKKKDFFFPLEMASTGSSQIGGVVSTNAGGVNVLRYGSVRNNILALNVVLATGDIIKLGSKVIKDNTGFNIKDLFCGSEGTLGIITKAILRIFPKVNNTYDFFAAFENLSDVIFFYSEISKKIKFPIVGFEMIPHLSFELCKKHDFIKKSFFKKEYPYYILVKIDVDFSSIKASETIENELANLSNFYQDLIVAQNKQQSNDFWKFREDLTEAQKLEGKLIGFDVSIPLNYLNNFFDTCQKQIDKILPNIKYHTFGHLGDSNIHYNLIEPSGFQEDFYHYEKEIKFIINSQIKKYEGSISAEHGIGILKKDDLIKTKSSLEINMMKNIKKMLDPKNILNSNKIFDI